MRFGESVVSIFKGFDEKSCFSVADDEIPAVVTYKLLFGQVLYSGCFVKSCF